MPRTHGMSSHPAYANWEAMRQRCNNPNSDWYHYYGGRGITVCLRWDSFVNFWEDMGPTWLTGLTLDRMDVNGPYNLDNCRWATRLEQSRNTRRTVRVEGLTLKEIALQYGFSVPCIAARWLRGDTTLQTLTRPRGQHVR
jgi:hypothetical protein